MFGKKRTKSTLPEFDQLWFGCFLFVLKEDRNLRIINKQTYIGVDGLEIQVKTKLRQNNIESKELYSKRTGVKIGRIKAISATGFRLYINRYTIDSGMESLTSNVTINLIPTGETYQQNKEDEQEIWEVENNIIIDDTSDLDDEWGEDDIYMG